MSNKREVWVIESSAGTIKNHDTNEERMRSSCLDHEGEHVVRYVPAEQQEWVSVKTHLPEEGVRVLVLGRSNECGVYFYDKARHSWYPGGWPVTATTHWRPRPLPPVDTQQG